MQSTYDITKYKLPLPLLLTPYFLLYVRNFFPPRLIKYASYLQNKNKKKNLKNVIVAESNYRQQGIFYEEER